jgi:hypothetical protein
MTDFAVTRTDDRHRYVWDGPEPAEIILERLDESKRDLTAELSISTPIHGIGHIYGPVKLNLLSDRSQKMLANSLTDRTDVIPWQVYLAAVSTDAINWLREGEPPEEINLETTYRTTWALEPVLETDGYTVIFARGGSGKSLLAATMALSIATGKDLLTGTPAICGPVLYCDWESSKDVLDWRLARLARPLGVTNPPIYYRREAGPLASKTRSLSRHISRLGIAAMVVDSKGLATSGAPESSDGILELARALRTLGTPTILIDHVSKGAIKGDDPNMAFGSQYVEAAARQAWSVASAVTPGGISLRLTNTKANNGRKARPVGVEYIFDGDEIHITTSEAPAKPPVGQRTTTADTGEGGPTAEERICDLLVIAPGQYSVKEIAEVLEISYEAAQKAIKRSDRLSFDHATRSVIDTGQDALPDPW